MATGIEEDAAAKERRELKEKAVRRREREKWALAGKKKAAQKK